MADFGLAIVLLGLLIVLASRVDEVPAMHLHAMATVIDGDSLTMEGERIRLRGIDAPEYPQQCLNGATSYPCGRLSRNALVRLIAERPVSCTGTSMDRYGRLLADCTVGGDEINRLQVAAGWAVAYGDFQAEEKSARERKAGIWAGTFERPSEWRRRHDGPPEPWHDDVLSWLGDWLRDLFRFR